MVSLSSALSSAVSGLTTSAAQTAVVARNISGAGNADYSRKSASIASLPDGGATASSYERSADKRLLDVLLSATSSSSAKQALLDGLTSLSETVGDPQSDSSIPALTSKLKQSLMAYEADPSNTTLASAVVQQAQTVVDGLHSASAVVSKVRQDADDGIGAAVTRINSLLQQFKTANDAVVQGTGNDLTDALDQRDSILKQLSDEIGIRTITRSNNDIAIYTDSGVTLFETTPRSVAFEATQPLLPGVTGKAVTVDGVAITGSASTMRGSGGRIQGLADLRDRIAAAYQAQLDETARGLIQGFAETGSSLPAMAGLFTNGTGASIPSTGTLADGLAQTITINAQASTNLSLIRDGGFNGASYVANSTGAAGYQARIASLISSFDETMAFDPSAGLGTSATLSSFGTASSAWLEAQRQAADTASSTQTALQSRAQAALQRVTGVNLDDEMAAMLNLEKSYQASAKIVSAVDRLLQSLMDAVN
ncbi:flagellar hook-associated protein FlgK [Aestuariivirga sp.]|uniref:flagellar hook-associated protein FlgK n=1 Tax=Aestuariivirga sp. TaxID=2650926 RepID=UPI0039E56573